MRITFFERNNSSPSILLMQSVVHTLDGYFVIISLKKSKNTRNIFTVMDLEGLVLKTMHAVHMHTSCILIHEITFRSLLERIIYIQPSQNISVTHVPFFSLHSFFLFPSLSLFLSLSHSLSLSLSLSCFAISFSSQVLQTKLSFITILPSKKKLSLILLILTFYPYDQFYNHIITKATAMYLHFSKLNKEMIMSFKC